MKAKNLPDCEPIGDKQRLMETLPARGYLRCVGVAVGDRSAIRDAREFCEDKDYQMKIKTSIGTSRQNKKKMYNILQM